MPKLTVFFSDSLFEIAIEARNNETNNEVMHCMQSLYCHCVYSKH